MLNKKIIIFIIVSISVTIPAHNIFAQGLDIGGTVSFSYLTSDGTDKDQTLESTGENFSRNYNYSLNIKKDLTSKGSARSAIRYSIGSTIKDKDETTDFNVELSYDKVSCSISLTDNTVSNYNVGVSNGKSTSFSFQINPQLLPRFSLTYGASVQDDVISPSSNNSMGVSLTKTFRVQNSDLSTAVSYDDSSDNITGTQNTSNMANINFGTNLMDDKISVNTGYRVGNSYNVNESSNNLTESGNFSLSYRVFDNLNISGDWAKNSNFPSETAQKDVNNSNRFGLNYSPITNLTFALSVDYSENQSINSILKSSSKTFSTKMPPILDVVDIAYSYGTAETENTLTVDNSLDFNLNLAELKINDLISNIRYGTQKSKTIDSDSYTTNGNFRVGISFKPIENSNLSYNYNLDKTTSNNNDDDRTATSNTVNADYNISLMENLNCSLGTSYGYSQDISPFTSNTRTDNTYNGNIDYIIGKVNINFAGSLSHSFDESGVHVNQRSSIGPGISTIFLGTSIAFNAAFGEDITDGELNETNSTDYSLNVNYPFGLIGSSSFSYSVNSKEDLQDPSSSSDSENIAFNMSFHF